MENVIAIVGVTLIALMIADQNKRIMRIMLDFSRINAALESVAASIDEVADAIRNPQVDNNSQVQVDALAGRLEDMAGGLRGLASEETAMDTADQIVEEEPAPLPEPEPAPEEIPPTGEGTDGNA